MGAYDTWQLPSHRQSRSPHLRAVASMLSTYACVEVRRCHVSVYCVGVTCGRDTWHAESIGSDAHRVHVNHHHLHRLRAVGTVAHLD